MPITCHAQGLHGDGPLNAKCVIIGMAPGAQEELQHKVFVGPTGQLLTSALEAVGVQRNQVYLTNLVCKRPTWSHGGDRDPTYHEIQECLPRLCKELQLIKPKLIVLLGTLVQSVMYPERDKGIRGALCWSKQFDTWMLPMYHPAYLLHNKDEEDVTQRVPRDFMRDLAKIPYMMGHPDVQPNGNQHIDYEVVKTHARAQQILDTIRDVWFIDFETDSHDEISADITQDTILCCAISNGTDTFVFPDNVLGNLVWPTHNVVWGAHYGLFDGQVAWRNCIFINIDEDTLLASYALDERPGVHGLKPLSREYLGVDFYEEGVGKKKMGAVPRHTLYEYNAKDAQYEARLHKLFMQRMLDDGVYNLYRYTLIPAQKAIIQTQHKGIHINKRELRKLKLEWLPRLLAKIEEIEELAGGPINPNSPKQLANVLYKKFRLPGGPSTDKKALLGLAGHPFVDALTEYRKIDHNVNNYIMKTEEQIKADGCVYPSAKLHASLTGRISYSDPPMHQFPSFESVAGGEDYGRVRDIFDVEEGHAWVSADYSRAELYVLAFHSGDKQLLADLGSGDIHRKAASTMFDKPESLVTEQERSTAKRFVYGVPYGLDAQGVVWQFGLTLNKAQEYIQGFFKRYPDVYKWILNQQRKAREDGEVVTAFGRKRRFPLIIHKHEWKRVDKQCVNCVIQGDSYDVTQSAKIALTPVLPYMYGSRVLFSVHDALEFDVHLNHIVPCLQLIHKVMTVPRHEKFGSIPIDIKVGTTWGNAKSINIAELVNNNSISGGFFL